MNFLPNFRPKLRKIHLGCVPATSDILLPAAYWAGRILYPSRRQIPAGSKYFATRPHISATPTYLSFHPPNFGSWFSPRKGDSAGIARSKVQGSRSSTLKPET